MAHFSAMLRVGVVGGTVAAAALTLKKESASVLCEKPTNTPFDQTHSILPPAHIQNKSPTPPPSGASELETTFADGVSHKPPAWTMLPVRVFSGPITGALEQYCLMPLDNIRKRALASESPLTLGNARNVLLHGAKTPGDIVETLWRGVHAGAANKVLQRGLVFLVQGALEKKIKDSQDHFSKPLSKTMTSTLAGAGAGLYEATFHNPLDLTKNYLQLNKGAPISAVQMAKEMYKSGGIRSFFYTYEVVALRNMSGTALWFGGSQKIKSMISKQFEGSSERQQSFAGAVSGSFLRLLAAQVPEVVRGRMISSDVNHGIKLSTKDAIKIVSNEVSSVGPSVLFRGFGVTCIAMMPKLTFALFVVNEVDSQLKAIIEEKQKESSSI